MHPGGPATRPARLGGAHARHGEVVASADGHDELVGLPFRRVRFEDPRLAGVRAPGKLERLSDAPPFLPSAREVKDAACAREPNVAATLRRWQGRRRETPSERARDEL